MLKIEEITIAKLKFGKLKKELPEFYELKKVIENNPWHDNESTFTHTLAVLKELENFLKNNKNNKLKKYLNERLDNYERKDLLYLAAVLHDLGKKETMVKKGKSSSFPKHEKVSAVKAKNILRKFNLSLREKNIVLGIIRNHSDLHAIIDRENKNLKTQFSGLMKLSKGFSIELIILVMVDTADSYLKKTMLERYDFRMNFYKEKLAKI
jgi:UTP:GlnB (protein PII) uridylyltransferase